MKFVARKCHVMPGGVITALLLASCSPGAVQETNQRVRFVTYNIEDLRTTDLLNRKHPRAMAAARTLQILRPDILLVNEITYDVERVVGYDEKDGPGANADRFVRDFLQQPQDSGLVGLKFRTFAALSNTGHASGFDLDNNGDTVTTFPLPEAAEAGGSAPRQTSQQRAYGDDSWGFGTFPGQYAMALFVSPRFEILYDSIRTFRRFLWSNMPEALRPTDPATGVYWYSDAEWDKLPLSSKSHWDVPVRLPNGKVVHVLASHPTPPAFDGPERRNKMRNHDEIQFWIDYLNGATYIVDDAGRHGGLEPNASFVIMGDLNADPDEGDTIDAIASKLLAHARVNGVFVPRASVEGIEAFPELDPDDTAEWGLRVDYVLPSANLRVLAGGVWRPSAEEMGASDHFPVWIDVIIGDSAAVTSGGPVSASREEMSR